MLTLAFAVFAALMAGSLAYGYSMLWALAAGFIGFMGVGLRQGFALPALLRMAWKGVRESLIVVRVMLTIGVLTGLWRAAGTFALLTAWGLRLISPSTFILEAFLLSCTLSYALGSSFGTAGTLGVALMTVARSGGVSELAAAGAILSGIYFGDRASPASSCANLVTALTSTDLYDNVKLMMRTALLPLLLALLVKSHVPGIGFFRALYYLPAISSLVVISLAWRYLLDQRGPVNNMLASWGVDPIPFLSNQWLILFCAMIITLWQGLPYYMILYLSALANVDKTLYEAAELDGAGPIRRFLTVTVPGVKVMMFLVATLTTIGCLKIFTEVYLLGGSASPTKTLTMYIRDRIVDPTFGSLGQGDAASVCLFLITFGFIIASQSLQRKAEDS